MPTELTLFKSRAPVMGYCFRSGKVVHFVNHMYTTTDQDEIDELTKECRKGHPNYYIDEAQTTISSVQVNPMEALREAIRQEEIAKLRAYNPNNDFGQTAQGKLEGIANSQSIRGMMATSDVQATLNPAGGGMAPTATPVTVNVGKSK